MIIVVFKADGRRVYAPKCGVRRLCVESNMSQAELWDHISGQYYLEHVDLLACVWVNDGADMDFAQAQNWAASSGWAAAIVPPDEEGHPLHWARKQARERFYKEKMTKVDP